MLATGSHFAIRPPRFGCVPRKDSSNKTIAVRRPAWMMKACNRLSTIVVQ